MNLNTTALCKSQPIIYTLDLNRGHSKTTWTEFWPFLTTHLPLVDKRGHLGYHLPFVHVDTQKMTTPLSDLYNMHLILLRRKGHKEKFILLQHIFANSGKFGKS